MKTITFRYSIMGIAALVVCVASSVGAEEGVPAFNNLRFEEDWSEYPDGAPTVCSIRSRRSN